jgi:hypothetical protein
LSNFKKNEVSEKKEALSGLDEMIINLKLELSRLNRDKSHLVLDKSLMLYFVFLFVGVLGFVNGYLSGTFLQILVYFGICVLVIGLVPYVMTMKKESDKMNELVETMEHAYKNCALEKNDIIIKKNDMIKKNDIIKVKAK